MPRVQKDQKPDLKPYDHSSSSSPPSDEVKTPSPLKLKATKSGRTGKGSQAKAGGYEYNKILIVALVLKTAEPDWQAIGSTLGKTSTQCLDLYRKTLLPALHSGRPWATTTSTWTSAEKVQLLEKVLKTTTTDWEDLANTFPDRTKAHIYDVWRKVILPKLKTGEVVA